MLRSRARLTFRAVGCCATATHARATAATMRTAAAPRRAFSSCSIFILPPPCSDSSTGSHQTYQQTNRCKCDQCVGRIEARRFDCSFKHGSQRVPLRTASAYDQVNRVERGPTSSDAALPNGSCLELLSQIAHALLPGIGRRHAGCCSLYLLIALGERRLSVGQRLFQCSDGLLCPSPFEPPSQKVRDRRAETHALLTGMRI